MITLKEFREKNGNLSFRRWLPDHLQEQWAALKDKIAHIQQKSEQDSVSWGWTSNGKFSVHSTYEQLTKDDIGDSYTRIWKSKVPYKIKIFLWLLERKATLTKDNMVKRKWTRDPTCRLCNSIETTEHLFFQCPTARTVWAIVALCFGVNTIPNSTNQYWRWISIHLTSGQQVYTLILAAICWATWKARNKACFEHKLIKHPAEIICHACSLMFFWAGLYKPDLQEQIADGVKLLLSMACRILVSQGRTTPTPLRILPATDETEERDDDEA